MQYQTPETFQVQREKDLAEMRLKIIAHKAQNQEIDKSETFTFLTDALNHCRKSGGFWFIGFQNSETKNRFVVWKPVYDETPQNTEHLFFIAPKKVTPLNDKAIMILKSLKFELKQRTIERD